MLDLKTMLLNIFDYFPFTEAKIDPRGNRISSVTFEAPALGTYLLSISGWMFSYIITSNSKWKYIPTIYCSKHIKDTIILVFGTNYICSIQ